jgi:predicted metalloenzyme YecM
VSVRFIEAVTAKDRALQTAIRAFAIIKFGGKLEPHEAKLFIDVCSLALPMRYRFPRQTWEDIEAGVKLSLSERAEKGTGKRNNSTLQVSRSMVVSKNEEEGNEENSAFRGGTGLLIRALNGPRPR